MRSSWSTPRPRRGRRARGRWSRTSREAFGPSSRFERNGRSATITNVASGLRTTVDISLPGEDDAAELWTITVENQGSTARSLKVVPYLEWVLNRPEADRGHTQYNRLFAEMEYAEALNAVLAVDRHAKVVGVMASDHAPEGFLTSRMDFIGRARSLGTPRVLETLAFSEPRDTPAHPTMDPIGSLLIGMTIPAKGLSRIRLLMGFAGDRQRAGELVARHLQVGDPGSIACRCRETPSTRSGTARSPPRSSNPIPSSLMTGIGSWSGRRSRQGPSITR